MKKFMTVGLVSLSLVGGFVAGKGFNGIKIDENGDRCQTIENNKVKVEYWDIKKTGGYDIVITTKNGSKVMTEFQMDEGKEYDEAYIVGKVK